MWRECGSACTATCDELTPTCDPGCVPRCECALGTVEHRGACVQPEACPDPGCANGKYRFVSPSTDFHYCFACPPGKYGRAVRGEGFCQLCPSGRVTDTYGEHDGGGAPVPCKSCAAGRFANAFGTSCDVDDTPLACVIRIAASVGLAPPTGLDVPTVAAVRVVALLLVVVVIGLVGV